MAIDRDEVRRIARLARLELDDRTLDETAGELGRILEYVARLERVPIDGVEPMAAPAVPRAPLREDEPRPRSGRRATRGAPDADHGMFRVPPVIDGRDPATGDGS